MDMSYATILVYGGEKLRLYKGVRFVHTVYKTDQPRNHPIYAIDQDLVVFNSLQTNIKLNSKLKR